MQFNSLDFLVFFPLVVLIFFLLPHKLRKYFLLLASVYFYICFVPKYFLIVLFTICVDFFGAILIDKFRERKGLKRTIFIIGILLNLSVFIIYKYLGVIGDTINFFGAMINLETVYLPELIIPIGISFSTFQSMGYFIDAYNQKIKVEKNFIDFSLFLMFFPQLVAGPIERYSNLMDQLKAKHTLKAENLSIGGRYMLWGMFKKVVVADSLAWIADGVFDNVEKFSGFGLVIGIFCFAFQIYCDFSGYSDIAIGAAKIMDINLMKNFDTPYFSQSTPEFWRRWHISLSTWFKDYLYIPLGGNRVSKPRWVFNQMLTFTASGIWHGAGYNFVIWGFLNGIYIVISRFTKPLRDKFKQITKLDKLPWLTVPFSVLITFIFISFTWIFFRANDFNDAIYIIQNLFAPTSFDLTNLVPDFRAIVAFASLAILVAVELIMSYGKKIVSFFYRWPHACRAILYCAVLLIIIIFGDHTGRPNNYFDF